MPRSARRALCAGLWLALAPSPTVADDTPPAWLKVSHVPHVGGML
jgi:hypothetical protein